MGMFQLCVAHLASVDGLLGPSSAQIQEISRAEGREQFLLPSKPHLSFAAGSSKGSILPRLDLNWVQWKQKLLPGLL